MQKKIKITLGIVLSLLLLILILFLATKVLTPKDTDPRERGLIEEYYDEVENDREHQVIFVGDCEVYESFTNHLRRPLSGRNTA